MEKETLFTAAKWDILKALSAEKKSPMELAEETGNSVSNISQSLRFLELAGLVHSERISNRDKGQPRVVYSLQGDNAYIIVTSQGFTEKKQITVDARKKIFFRIWLFENENLHRFLEKAYEHIEQDLDRYEGIALKIPSIATISIGLIPKEKATEKTVKDIKHEHNGVTRDIKYHKTSWEEINKDPEKYYVIHDPQLKFRGSKK